MIQPQSETRSNVYCEHANDLIEYKRLLSLSADNKRSNIARDSRVPVHHQQYAAEGAMTDKRQKHAGLHPAGLTE